MKTLNKFLNLTALSIGIFSFYSCGPTKEDSTTALERENRDRSRQVYAQYEGLYRGFLTPLSGDTRPQPIEMELRMIEVRSGSNEKDEPTFRTELRGYFLPVDVDLSILPQGKRPVSARVYADRDEIALENLDLIPGRLPNHGQVSLTGNFKDGVITGRGSYYVVKSASGNFRFERVAP